MIDLFILLPSQKATLVSAVDVYEEEESELLISFNRKPNLHFRNKYFKLNIRKSQLVGGRQVGFYRRSRGVELRATVRQLQLAARDLDPQLRDLNKLM